MKTTRKQRVFSVLSAALLLVGLCACGAGTQRPDAADASPDTSAPGVQTPGTVSPGTTIPVKDAPPTDDKEPRDTEKPEASQESEPDYAQLYDEILQSGCLLLTDRESHTAADGEMGMLEATSGMEPAQALDAIGYRIEDISGDGVPELLIGYAAPNDAQPASAPVYALYTCKDGAPVLVFEGWYRNAYYFLGGGRFLNLGSASAMCSIAASYRISADGTQLACEDFYYTYEKDGSSSGIGYYHNKTGLLEPAASEALDSAGEAFQNAHNALMGQIVHPAFTAFSEYARSQGYAIPGTAASVCAQWAQDTLQNFAVFEEFTVDDGEYAADVLFTTDRDVTEFELLRLEVLEIRDDGSLSFSAETLCRLDRLTPQRPLLSHMSFPGDLPAYGICYVDGSGDGAVHRFSLSISGKDGALILDEVSNW